MLRAVVLILLLLNASFYAWTRGWLTDVVGISPDGIHEPDRLQGEVNATRIEVIPPSSVQPEAPAPQAPEPEPPASAAADEARAMAVVDTSAAGICLEAGPFSDADFARAEAALPASLPPDSWASHAAVIQGLWMIYMGPYNDPELFDRKVQELRKIKGVEFDIVRSPSELTPGLSLGRYSRQDNAEAALQHLRTLGVRSARIVNERPRTEVQWLRVPQATPRMQVALANVTLPQGKTFSACRR